MAGPLMTMGEAADLAGFDGKWKTQRMRRYLARREARDGVTILIRGRKGGTLMVTERLLRDHCPELFSDKSDAEKAILKYTVQMRALFAELQDKLVCLENRINAIGTSFGEHLARHHASPAARGDHNT